MVEEDASLEESRATVARSYRGHKDRGHLQPDEEHSVELGGLEIVNQSDVKALLNSLRTQGAGISSEVGKGREALYLKFWLDLDPGDCVTIWINGTVWYVLEVPRGFENRHVEEDASDAEVAAVLEGYVEAAIAYLRGRRTTIRSRVFKVPSVRVDTDHGPVRLTLSIADGVKAIFRRPGSGVNWF